MKKKKFKTCTECNFLHDSSLDICYKCEGKERHLTAKRLENRRRRIIHVRAEDRPILDAYLQNWIRCTPFPVKLSKEGYAEYYRRVILGRLQNRSYADIAGEHGITAERVRQIWCRFVRYCERKKHSLDRKLIGKI